MDEKASFSAWCLVELFGHARIAGLVSEQAIGGGTFVRVDVPATDEQPPFTKLYGPAAIYAITPVPEEIARAAAKTYRIAPVTRTKSRNCAPCAAKAPCPLLPTRTRKSSSRPPFQFVALLS